MTQSVGSECTRTGGIDVKKKRLLVLAMGMCLLGSMQAWASESDVASNYVTAFAQKLSAQDDNYALWIEAEPRYGYELYGQEMPISPTQLKNM